MEKFVPSDETGGVMNYRGVQKLVRNLRRENDSSNDEWIAILERQLEAVRNRRWNRIKKAKL